MTEKCHLSRYLVIGRILICFAHWSQLQCIIVLVNNALINNILISQGSFLMPWCCALPNTLSGVRKCAFCVSCHSSNTGLKWLHINLTLAKSDCESGDDRSPGALWKVVWLTIPYPCYLTTHKLPTHIPLQVAHTIWCKSIEIVAGTNDFVKQHIIAGSIWQEWLAMCRT